MQAPNHLLRFEKIVSLDRVHIDQENLRSAASDHTEDLVFLPNYVVEPISVEELSELLRYCFEEGIKVTPRGAGTGLSGGCLPLEGGLVLDMKRMNHILEIDEESFQVTTEPGVITEVLQDAVKQKGLYYPVDPASKGSCFIGGNVAENSGGMRAVKYGVVKDYVLNLEVVLANGEVIWTGANTLKNATGYNLTQLIIGSEGTLAVITKIVLKLLPYPKKDLLILVPFHSAQEACNAVSKVFQAGFNPSALEFMERAAMEISQKYIDDFSLKIAEHTEAFLLIEVNGNEEEVLMKEIEGIVEVLNAFETGEILFADNQKDKDRLWRLRKVTGEAAKHSSVYKEEDTVVPRAKLPQLLAKVKELGHQFGFESVCYGHAGDGNLHVNILKNEMTDEAWKVELPKVIRLLFEYTKSLGGTLSGEHGIGYVQKEYMDIVFNTTTLELMRQIKQVFDPKNILNPGKIFPK